MKQDLLFVIQAYNEKFADGSIGDVVVLELFAPTETEALTKARALCKRKEYRVSSIIEQK